MPGRGREPARGLDAVMVPLDLDLDRLPAPPSPSSSPSCRPSGHGPVGRPLPPGITVRGGAGGTRAHLEDLGTAAAALDRAAESLEHAADRCNRVAQLVEQAAPWARTTAPAARGSLGPLLSTSSGAAATAHRARTTAAALRAAAGGYAQADRDVSALLRAGFVVAGHVIGEGGPLRVALATAVTGIAAAQVAVDVAVLRALRFMPGPLGWFVRELGSERRRASGGFGGSYARLIGGPGVLPRSLGLPTAGTVQPWIAGIASTMVSLGPGRSAPRSDPIGEAAASLASGARAATLLLGSPRDGLVVAPVVGGGPRATTPPRGVGDMLETTAQAYPTVPGGAGRSVPGSVVVQRLDHADGTVSVVVTVPGTQEWSPVAGTNPMDLTTNLRAMAEMPDDVAEAVVQAMLQAGVGPGDPVALVGHSQGGLVAMGLALDPTIQKHFNIQAVATAGSPVGSLEGTLPSGTVALHLENAHDLGPAADGVDNPDGPQRTTVVIDSGRVAWGEGPEVAMAPDEAHDVSGYAVAGHAIERSSDPSIRAFNEHLESEVLGDGTAVVTTNVYQAVRMP